MVGFREHCPIMQTANSNREARLGKCDKETSFKILDTFYENGGNFIDT